jgi:transmembrane sensor
MTPIELDQLIKKYLEGACNEEETHLVERIYFLAGSQKAEVPLLSPEQETELEKRLTAKVIGHAHKSRRLTQPVKNKRWLYAAAASITILIASGIYLLTQGNLSTPVSNTLVSSKKTYLINDSKVSQTVALADGSFITLGPQSKLRIALDSIPKSRIVFLEGEAFFDVAPDKSKPFFVYAQSVVTKVLGTSFNVKAFTGDEHITVSVVEGRVSVSDENRGKKNKEIILLPNQEAVFNKSLKTVLSQAAEDPILMDSIFNTSMKFDEEPVVVILETLEKTYHVKIEFDPQRFELCKMTTTFVDETLRDRLSVICSAIGSTYKTVDNQIVMNSPNCSNRK